MPLKENIQADLARVVAFRHDLHQNPELMYEEERTSAQVQNALRHSGVEFKAGLAGGTGVLAYLPATEPGGKTVALRADMDALPIHEETGLPYASQTPGKMHACGHDGHTAILVGTVHALAQEPVRRNNVLFLFQPAEEGGAGGRRMVEDGCLSGGIFPVKADVIYGLHGWPSDEVGQIFTCDGPMLAATDQFRVTLKGTGGHAAAPAQTQDSVVALAQIITALQTIASRNVEPLDSIVVSVTAVSGGTAFNVIPEEVEFKGTMRTLLHETRHLGKSRFHQIVTSIAEAFGIQANIDWREGYPVTANHPWSTDRFRQIARQTVGESRVHELQNPVMGGEDFSFYGSECPATFYFVGLKRPGDTDPAMVHTPRFDFNDTVIPDCIELMSQLTLQEII